MAKSKPKSKQSQGMVVSKKRQQWLTTYGVLTAESVYKNYDLSFSSDELAPQASRPQSFYHWVLKLPLLNAYNNIIIDQVQSQQTATQKLMIDYIYSGEATKVDEGEGSVIHEQLERDRKDLILIANNFAELQDRHYDNYNAIDALISESLDEWQTSIKRSTVDMCQVLREEGIELAADFEPRLQKRLDRQAIGHDLGAAQLKRYKLKQQPCVCIRAVVSLLEEDSGEKSEGSEKARGPKLSTQTYQEIERLCLCEQRLDRMIDDVTAFETNHINPISFQAMEAQNKIKQFTQTFSGHLGALSRLERREDLGENKHAETYSEIIPPAAKTHGS